MKKNVVKAMSVGLSAMTIASSMSVTAYANEPASEAAPAPEPVVDAQPVVQAPTPEQTVANDAAALNQSYNGAAPVVTPDVPADAPKLVGVLVAPQPAPVAQEAQPISDAPEQAQPTQDVQPTVDTETTLEEVQDVVDAAGASDIAADTYENSEGEDITYTEGAEAVQDDAVVAGDAIAAADTAASNMNQAAEDMDTADDAAGDALVDATEAATSANTEIAKANSDVAAAAQAVATGTQSEAAALIATAESSVAAAETKFESAKSDYESILSEYQQAVADYEAALAAYNSNKETLSANLVVAEEKLAAAQVKLAELGEAVADAQKEFADAGADALLTAEANKDTNKDAYVEAIMTYYYIPTVYGDTLTKDNDGNADITVAKDGDNYVVSYVANGKTVVREYTYSIKEDGTFEINEIMYKYNDGKTDYELTKQEMEAKVTDGSAVKRYEIKTVENDKEVVTYKTEAELTADEKTTATYSYVVLGSSVSDDADQYATTITCFFNENGQYIKAVKDSNLNKIVITIDGQQVTTAEYFAESEDADKVKAAIVEMVGESTVSNIEMTTTRTITAVGTFVARYTDKLSWSSDNFDQWTGTYHGFMGLKFSPDAKPDGSTAISDEKGNAEDSWKNKYDDKHDYYGVTFDGFNNDWSASERWHIEPTYVSPDLGTVLFHVTGSGNISYSRVTFDTTDFSTWEGLADIFRNIGNLFGADITTAKEKATKAAKAKVESQGGIFVDLKWDDFNWNKATVYYVEATDVANTNTHYASEADAQAAVNAQVSSMGATGTINNKISYEDWYQAKLSYDKTITTFDAIKNADARISDSEGSSYDTFLDKVKSYAALLKEVNEAQAALSDAQDKVDAIKAELENCKKNDEQATVVAEWEKLLDIAENNKDNAQKNLDDAKKALDDTKSAYDDKYPSVNPAGPTGGTGGITGTPVVYPGPATLTATVSDEEVEIPEDAVPLAGQAANRVARARRATVVADADADTTTIAEANTPLAGDGAADEEKEDEVVAIENDKTPLAGGSQKSFLEKTWWGWLLLLIAALAGGTAYAKKKAKATSNINKTTK